MTTIKSKLIISLLIIYQSVFAFSIQYYKKQLIHTNQEQREVARFISHNASKYNLKYTLLAIAFKESQWGRFKLNLADPSAGLFHKLLSYYCVELGLKPNQWNMSRVAERLVNNNAESLMVALYDFQRNYKYFIMKGYPKKLAWRYAIQAYNAGVSNYRAGKKYYREIVKIIKALKQLGY